jgi:hypothetical protein
MKFNELEKKQQNHVNGVLAKYMDQYIREHLVWTPEQMYCDLVTELKKEHSKGWYGNKFYINGEGVFIFKEGNLWMVTDDAKDFIIDRFNKKYEKNKKLARKKSPLIDRARFGLQWDKGLFYDINYGLKDEYNLEKMDIVESCNLIPWSIEHVEFELNNKYSTSLENILLNLSRSPIEVKFYKEWMKYFFSDKSSPALIPEFCGDRHLYYCF